MHIIVNVHLLAILVYKRHTVASNFDIAAEALDVLFLSWKDSIIGISSDGERKRTSRIEGITTQFQSVSKPAFIRIWYGAHQLDIVLQSAYSKLGNKAF